MKNLWRDSAVVGFALFAMFFGAGNIIFPPHIGLVGGPDWFTGFIAYYFADIVLALLAIFALLKAGNITRPESIMYRLGKIPARIMMSALIISIGPLLAVPRTAATSFEMGFLPVTGLDSLPAYSIVYFALVWLFAIRESRLVDIVGKFLTPALVIGLCVMIAVGMVNPIAPIATVAAEPNIFLKGIISGYQTMDVLAAIIFGLIVVNALHTKGYTGQRERFVSVAVSSLICGVLMFIVYGGLCFIGATVSSLYPADMDHAKLVVAICQHIFGRAGVVLLGIVAVLACMTTAIALVGSCGSFFSRMSGNKLPYNGIVTLACIFSAAFSNFGLDFILKISVPILLILYPAVLVMVILSLFNDRIHNDNICKLAALGALLTSTCQVLAGWDLPFGFISKLPLAADGFAWVVPAAVLGVVGFFIKPAGRSKTA